MTIGEMLRSFLTKLEWFSTLFPRIPVPVQKNIDQQIKTRPRKIKKDGKEGTDPIDGSPPGSPVPGILHARTLEWVAISFSNAGK